MGNRSPTGGLRPTNGDHPSQADLRQGCRIVFKGKKVGEVINTKELIETWEMVYSAGTSTCQFILQKYSERNFFFSLNPTPHDEFLQIKIHDTINGSKIYLYLWVNRDEAGSLIHPNNRPYSDGNVIHFVTITTDAWGDIIETVYDIYGSGKRRGLMVSDWKRKSEDKYPYTGNVTHYFVSDESGEDVGLSVAVRKIKQSDDGNFDFVVDGPEQHPARALTYMIDEVIRTRTWKPSYCPHCANRYIDESESDKDNVPAPPLHGRTTRNNSGSMVSNHGCFKGKDIGNTYIKNFFGRKW